MASLTTLQQQHACMLRIVGVCCSLANGRSLARLLYLSVCLLPNIFLYLRARVCLVCLFLCLAVRLFVSSHCAVSRFLWVGLGLGLRVRVKIMVRLKIRS